MGIEDLTEFEIASGILGLIALAISLIVGIKIIAKYFQHKRHELLAIGLMMIFVSSGWWAALSAFLLFILFDFYFPTTLFLVLSYGLTPISHLLWIYAFGYLVYPKSKWKFFLIFAVISGLYELYFWYFIITDPAVIGTRTDQFIYDGISPLIQLYILYIIVVSLITIYIFAKECLRSDNPKTKWRGKFLVYSMITLAANTVLAIVLGIYAETLILIFVPPYDITLLLVMNILIYLSTILSYIGWIMPDRVLKWLTKESE